MIARVLCVFAGIAGLQAQVPAEDWRPLIRTVLSNLRDSDARFADYGYDRFNVRRQYESDGTIKSERTVLARRSYLEDGGFWFTQQIERNGKAVPKEELERGLESFRKENALPAEERAKRNAAEHNRRVENYNWLKEFPDALVYRKAGEETISGRPTLVLEFTPRPDYKPANIRARVFSKLRGKIWIDQADSQIVRVDAEVFDTVNIGWGVLGKVHKGTRYQAERSRLEDGAWVPVSQTVRFAARVMLVKSLSQEETTRYSSFRNKSRLLAWSGEQFGKRQNDAGQ